MPDVSGLAALDVLVGLFFLYFLLSIVCSSVQEFVAQVLNLRAKTLEEGVRNLVGDENLTERFFRHPRLKSLSKPRVRLRSGHGPSYIPSRVFAITLMDTLFPEEHGRDVIALAREAVDDEDVPARVRTMLRDALDQAGDRRDRLTAALERSFDEGMDRVSGWYKRRASYTLLAIAVLVVAIVNVDTFAVAQRLWKDKALRAAVAAQAADTTAAGAQACPGTTPDDSPQERAAKCVDDVDQLSLPVGWTAGSAPDDWKGVLAKIGGLLVSAFALALGAPFWFDLLSKIARLRASGPPAPPREEREADRPVPASP
ncbi:MAG TPA: hypothetical protein VGQ15_01990 [Gaiellaceae bacterium]|jgi:hypothetical protein|nr:hypothetical protein [Gaiellaceae bacterium]